MKKVTKFLFAFVFVFTLVMTMKTVQASLLSDIFGFGGNFFKGGFTNTGDDFSKEFVNQLNGGTNNIVGAIKTVGYTIFFITGTILGVKYMWAGAEGKAMVKDGLVAYLAGVLFFFLGDQIFSFIRDVLVSDVSKQNSYASLEANIVGNLNMFVQVLAIGAVVYAGIRYMWSNSADKAGLKQSSITMVIGAVLALCLTQVLNFVIEVADNEILPDENVKAVQYVEMPTIHSDEYKL